MIHARGNQGEDWGLKVYPPDSLRTEDLKEVHRRLLRLRSPGVRDHFVASQLHEKLLRFPDLPDLALDATLMPYLADTHWTLHRAVMCLREGGAFGRLAQFDKWLRGIWLEMASANVAHGDLCSLNIMVPEPRKLDSSARPKLIDIDTLCLGLESEGAMRTSGHPGYRTEGRRRDQRKYARTCMESGKSYLIDLPSELIISISLAAYGLNLPDLPEPDHTLLFTDDDLHNPEMREIQLGALEEKLKLAGKSIGRSPNPILTLISELRLHLAHPVGIDVSRPSPFLDEALGVALDELHQSMEKG